MSICYIFPAENQFGRGLELGGNYTLVFMYIIYSPPLIILILLLLLQHTRPLKRFFFQFFSGFPQIIRNRTFGVGKYYNYDHPKT